MINYLQQLHKAGINNTFEALLLAAIAENEGCCIDDLMQRLAIKKTRSNYEKVKIRLHKLAKGEKHKYPEGHKVVRLARPKKSDDLPGPPPYRCYLTAKGRKLCAKMT